MFEYAKAKNSKKIFDFPTPLRPLCSAGCRGFRIKEKVARSDTVILISWALFREKCCICFFNLFVHFFAKNAQIIYYSAFQKATFVTLHNTLKKLERAGFFTLLHYHLTHAGSFSLDYTST